MLDPHLGRAENMPCWMQRYLDTVDGKWLAIGNRLNSGIVAQAGTQHTLAITRGQVAMAAPASMIAMGVCDNGALNWTPRVDIKIASGAVEPTISELDQ